MLCLIEYSHKELQQYFSSRSMGGYRDSIVRTHLWAACKMYGSRSVGADQDTGLSPIRTADGSLLSELCAVVRIAY